MLAGRPRREARREHLPPLGIEAPRLGLEGRISGAAAAQCQGAGGSDHLERQLQALESGKGGAQDLVAPDHLVEGRLERRDVERTFNAPDRPGEVRAHRSRLLDLPEMFLLWRYGE